MKILLKLLLGLCLVVAGIYAATPLWLPHILAGQLPPGWQLEELQSGYPGLAGVNVDHLRVKGRLATAGVELTSSDLRFTYKGLQSEIGLVSVDIYLDATETGPDESLSLEDLSLPVTKLTGKLPRLSVDQAHVTLHQTGAFRDVFTRPLMLRFDGIALTPHSDHGFHLVSKVFIAQSPQLNARLDVNVKPGLLDAGIIFPSSQGLQPWLAVNLEQKDLPAETTTRLQAVLNADLANREWLDSLLAGGTGHLFTQLGGKLDIQANFAGKQLQGIETLSLTSENLLLVTDQGTLNLDTDLLLNREGEAIAVKLQAPTKIQYRGDADRVDSLLKGAVPGLQLMNRPEININAELGSESRVSLFNDSGPPVRFNGNIDIDLNSDVERLKVQSAGLQIDMADMQDPESIIAQGLISIDWEVLAPFSWSSEDLSLEGKEFSMTAELVFQDGSLISTGDGTLMQVDLAPDDISAEKLEVTWQEVDLSSLTGSMDIRTHGFTTLFNNETWTGFDFDTSYTLLGKTGSSGAGTFRFSGGQEIPFEFTGESTYQRWSVKLLPASIEL